MKVTTFLILTLFTVQAYSQAVVKSCPTSGSTLLDETYPTKAFVISIKPFKDFSKDIQKSENRATQVPVQFALNIFKSYDYNKNTPEIIIPSDEEKFKEFIKILKEEINNSDGKIPKSILTKIKRADGRNYTWQQDYFESLVNLQTGNPELRKIEAFEDESKNGKNTLKAIVAATNSSISLGKKIPTYHEQDLDQIRERNPTKRVALSFSAGESGGNIEGLPGGLCLTGDNLSKDFTKEICGEGNNVQIHTSWLDVGHVDEIFKVIPTNIPGVPKQCQFSIMAASPVKALELLKKSGNQNRDFLESYDGYENKSIHNANQFNTSRTYDEQGPGKKICELIEKNIIPYRSPTTPSNNVKTNVHGAFLQFIRELSITNLYAQSNSFNCKKHLTDISNIELFKGIQRDKKLLHYNEAIQNDLNESKLKIKQKILERLPECKKYFSFIDVPNIFYGDELIKDGDNYRLQKTGGTGSSLFPNPTNSVLANKTLMFSDPHNNNFREYLNTEMKKIGLKSTNIDTWEYSHIARGNLHCASHSITYCKAN